MFCLDVFGETRSDDTLDGRGDEAQIRYRAKRTERNWIEHRLLQPWSDDGMLKCIGENAFGHRCTAYRRDRVG